MKKEKLKMNADLSHEEKCDGAEKKNINYEEGYRWLVLRSIKERKERKAEREGYKELLDLFSAYLIMLIKPKDEKPLTVELDREELKGVMKGIKCSVGETASGYSVTIESVKEE